MINMMMMLMITAGLESAAAAAGQLDVGRTRRRSNLVDATRHRRRATGRRSTHRSATAVRRPTAALSTPTQHSWTTTTQVKRSRQQCVCVCVCVCVCDAVQRARSWSGRWCWCSAARSTATADRRSSRTSNACRSTRNKPSSTASSWSLVNHYIFILSLSKRQR